MGVSLPRVQKEIFGVSSLLVGVAVSASGLIGFVGLIVPHGIRQWIGADHRIVLPMSILVGGGFLLACDLIARALFPVLGTDAPVGVVTSLVGGPVFLWMLMGKKGEIMAPKALACAQAGVSLPGRPLLLGPLDMDIHPGEMTLLLGKTGREKHTPSLAVWPALP